MCWDLRKRTKNIIKSCQNTQKRKQYIIWFEDKLTRSIDAKNVPSSIICHVLRQLLPRLQIQCKWTFWRVQANSGSRSFVFWETMQTDGEVDHTKLCFTSYVLRGTMQNDEKVDHHHTRLHPTSYVLHGTMQFEVKWQTDDRQCNASWCRGKP